MTWYLICLKSHGYCPQTVFSQNSHCVIALTTSINSDILDLVFKKIVFTELTNINPLSCTKQGTDFISVAQYFITKRPIIIYNTQKINTLLI